MSSPDRWTGSEEHSTPDEASAAPSDGITWRRSPSVLWRRVLDDVVLAHPEGDDRPFALSGGAALWDALEEWRELPDLETKLNLGASPGEQARLQLLQLLEDLRQAGVVESSA